jgi:DNA-binding transcriptional ArsR family regulator
MPHPAEHSPATRPLERGEAETLATTLKALGSPARLRLLVSLLDGEMTVERLASAAGLGQSATSHNLRLLRDLRLVQVRREGRHAFYSLHDHHVADLLEAVRHHHEHAHWPKVAGPPASERATA